MMCNINYRIFGVVVGKTLLRPSLQIHNNKEQIKNPKRIIKRTIFSNNVFYLLILFVKCRRSKSNKRVVGRYRHQQ
jgi:hypothetical protein